MIVEKILKQLTPERIRKEIKTIQKIKLPPKLQGWIGAYKKVGKRDDFVWKWTYLGWQIFTLSCVKKEYRESVIQTKICNTMLNVLIDDIADKKRDGAMLNESLNILLDSPKTQSVFTFSKIDQNYLDLIKEIWNFIKKTIEKYPRYKEFEDIFNYDCAQFLNALKYSYLINQNQTLINLTEHEIYSHHNMQGIMEITIDLMCSPKFETKELGIFREISWKTQQMGGIGNSIATWEKEIHENDFTSGIIAYAIKNNLINLNDLRSIRKEATVKKIKTSKSEKYFLNKWENYYKDISCLAENVRSINIEKILKAHEKFLMMHLISRGLEI